MLSLAQVLFTNVKGFKLAMNAMATNNRVSEERDRRDRPELKFIITPCSLTLRSGICQVDRLKRWIWNRVISLQKLEPLATFSSL